MYFANFLLEIQNETKERILESSLGFPKVSIKKQKVKSIQKLLIFRIFSFYFCGEDSA